MPKLRQRAASSASSARATERVPVRAAVGRVARRDSPVPCGRDSGASASTAVGGSARVGPASTPGTGAPVRVGGSWPGGGGQRVIAMAVAHPFTGRELINLKRHAAACVRKMLDPSADHHPITPPQRPLELYARRGHEPAKAQSAKGLHRHFIVAVHLLKPRRQHVVEIAGAVHMLIQVDIVGSDREFALKLGKDVHESMWKAGKQEKPPAGEGIIPSFRLSPFSRGNRLIPRAGPVTGGRAWSAGRCLFPGRELAA